MRSRYPGLVATGAESAQADLARCVPRGRRDGRVAQTAGRLLARPHGRHDPVYRPRPAGHPAACAGSPRARLGGRGETAALAIDEHGLRAHCFAKPEPKGCLFEFVYLARPDTTISDRSVPAPRVDICKRLAREHPVEADLVIPVPESGRYAEGLVKNAYVGRTFIQPSQTIRQLGILFTLNPLREVHVRISSRPVTWPCFYGIDVASRAELIANGLSVEEICRSIGADSLG